MGPAKSIKPNLWTLLYWDILASEMVEKQAININIKTNTLIWCYYSVSDVI